MSVTIPVAKKGDTLCRIRYSGLFDWAGLYKMMHDWLVNDEFEVHEYKYKHKVPGLGGEDQLGWRCWRKESEYVRFWINVNFHLWSLKEVQVIRDGKSVTLMSGRIWIDFMSDLELDYEGKFEGSKFREELRNFYHKFIIWKNIDMLLTDKLWYVMYKLQTKVKEFLDLESQANASYEVW